jgi:hypothetical protein
MYTIRELLNILSSIQYDNRIFFRISKPHTERVVNIIWTLEDKTLEGFCTNSVFRVINPKHELEMLEGESEYIIEKVAADATPLCCPIDRFSHEHGCYSAV